MTGRITVGMPLYNGQDLVADALRSLQAQSFADFDVIISVDGNDQASADACRPFLADTRFRMVVQPERLDWVGNFNWLLQQPMGELFCYRQHDDTTAPDFFEKLLARADERRDAAIVYADCQFVGESTHVETTPSIQGATLPRLKQFIEQIRPTACRGIIRREAIAQAGSVRVDEFRSNQQIFVWLAKVLRWGSFLRFAEPIYYRRLHAENYSKQNHRWSDEKKLGDWSTVFTGFLEAVLPACSSIEERVFFQHFILDRLCVLRAEQAYWIRPKDLEDSGRFMVKCFERLAAEGHPERWLAPYPAAIANTQTLVDALRLREGEHLAALQQAGAEQARLRREITELKSQNKVDTKALTTERNAITRERDALRKENKSLRNSRAVRFARFARGLLGWTR